MKRTLLTTTALVAAGTLAQAAQAKPMLELGGWFEGILGVIDDDNPNGSHVGADVQQDSELHFNGAVVLDNGIKIRTRTELEAQSANSSDIIDEAYMDISGNFGAFRIGSEDSVAHLMHSKEFGSWAVQVGQELQDDTGDWVEAPSGHTASTSVRLSLGEADAEKVTYFTPRIGGFQAGASYIPSFSEGDNGEPESTTENPHSGWSVAANYAGKLSGASFGLAAGYTVMKPASGQDQSKPKGWGVAGSVDIGAFKLAAGYSSQKNLDTETSGAPTDGDDAFDVGGSYTFGKNAVSLAWVHSEDDAGSAAGAGGASRDESDAVMASYRRDLAPGVEYRLNLIYADYQGAAVGSADDNEGMALTTSVRLAF